MLITNSSYDCKSLTVKTSSHLTGSGFRTMSHEDVRLGSEPIKRDSSSRHVMFCEFSSNSGLQLWTLSGHALSPYIGILDNSPGIILVT
ncbi:hypothetical protein TNCV_2126711 [Trichonephila clavipes]|nr:hypothetical protein TNCV_2126711 [Trichonephila clavipes]